MAYDGTLIFDTQVDSSGVESSLNKINGLLKTLMIAEVASKVIDLGKAAVSVGIEWESAFAGVTKTVEGTDEQIAAISQGIRDLAKEMPQSAAEIAGVAEAAGQLGIETENVLDFTKNMVMMGDATNLSSEEAATALARLANITQMPQTEFSNLGSAIVALGNNMATTESDITNMAVRLAAAGTQAGFSEADMVALSAALSSVGVNAEAGGGAMSRVLNQMSTAVATGGDDLAAFANVAGMSADEFKTAWGENAAGAFNEFVKGLGKAKEEGKNTSMVLSELGITETIATSALSSLAIAGDLLGDSLNISNEAWAENTALTNEAAQRYETMESKIAMVKNRLADIGITIYDSLKPALSDVVDAVSEFLDGFAEGLENGDIQGKIQSIIDVISALAPVIVAATGAFAAFKIAMTISETISSVQKALTAFKTAQEASTLAQAALNAVMNLNPFVLIATLIGAVVAALIYFWNTNEDFRNAVEPIWEAIKMVITSAAEAVMAIWNVVSQFLSTLWESISTTATTAWTNFSAIITAIISPFIETFKTWWEGLKESLALIWEGIQTTASGAWELIKTVIMAPITILIDLINGDFTKLKEDLSAIWGNIKSAAGTIWEGLATLLSGIVQGILNNLTAIWEAIKTAVLNIITGIKDGAVQLWGNIKQSVSDIVTGMGDAISGVWDNIKQWTSDTWENIKETILSIGDIDLMQIGKDIIQGLIDGISSMIQGVKDTVGNIASSIKDTLTGSKGLDTHSPSKFTHKVGVYTDEGLILGMESAEKDVYSTIAKLGKGMQTELSGFDVSSAFTDGYSASIQSQLSFANDNPATAISNNSSAMGDVNTTVNVYPTGSLDDTQGEDLGDSIAQGVEGRIRRRGLVTIV